jgi:hypothetical protein
MKTERPPGKERERHPGKERETETERESETEAERGRADGSRRSSRLRAEAALAGARD